MPNSNPKSTILIQLDSDAQPSVFDRVVAIDAGAQEVFSYGKVQVQQVQGLVHGAIFTRSPADLHRTAVFVGGSDVEVGEKLLKAATEAFIGPMRVSVMLDANGANTTAAAAVLTARKHLGLAGIQALVLAGTGPVGRRVVRLLVGENARVHLASRSFAKAQEAARTICGLAGQSMVQPIQIADDHELAQAMAECELLIAAGSAGVRLASASVWQQAGSLKVAIDLNAVPPEGIEGIGMMDKAVERAGQVHYGAISVGGLKMKIHKAALASLFTASDRVLDASEIYELGKSL